jgi:hypothetical protein
MNMKIKLPRKRKKEFLKKQTAHDYWMIQFLSEVLVEGGVKK